MTVDAKKLYKDKIFKKKYFKNFKAKIKVVSFDEKIVPLYAIFIFNESNINNYNIIKHEKNYFPELIQKKNLLIFLQMQ